MLGPFLVGVVPPLPAMTNIKTINFINLVVKYNSTSETKRLVQRPECVPN